MEARAGQHDDGHEPQVPPRLHRDAHGEVSKPIEDAQDCFRRAVDRGEEQGQRIPRDQASQAGLTEEPAPEEARKSDRRPVGHQRDHGVREQGELQRRQGQRRLSRLDELREVAGRPFPGADVDELFDRGDRGDHEREAAVIGRPQGSGDQRGLHEAQAELDRRRGETPAGVAREATEERVNPHRLEHRPGSHRASAVWRGATPRLRNAGPAAVLRPAAAKHPVELDHRDEMGAQGAALRELGCEQRSWRAQNSEGARQSARVPELGDPERLVRRPDGRVLLSQPLPNLPVGDERVLHLTEGLLVADRGFPLLDLGQPEVRPVPAGVEDRQAHGRPELPDARQPDRNHGVPLFRRPFELACPRKP